jgi:hypothetical protein
MLNLICCQSVARDLVPPVGRMRGLGVEGPRVADPQEPIHVRVRVREYGDSALGAPQGRSTRPDLGRMPVGTLLDCYV